MSSEHQTTEITFKEEYESVLYSNLVYKVREEEDEDGTTKYVVAASLKNEDMTIDVMHFTSEQLHNVLDNSGMDTLEHTIVASANISVSSIKDTLFTKMQTSIVELNNLAEMYVKLM